MTEFNTIINNILDKNIKKKLEKKLIRFLLSSPDALAIADFLMENENRCYNLEIKGKTRNGRGSLVISKKGSGIYGNVSFK